MNARGGEYGNALQAASYMGSTTSVIARARADVNAQGGPFGNALIAVNYNSNLQILQILLDHGAVLFSGYSIKNQEQVNESDFKQIDPETTSEGEDCSNENSSGEEWVSAPEDLDESIPL